MRHACFASQRRQNNQREFYIRFKPVEEKNVIEITGLRFKKN